MSLYLFICIFLLVVIFVMNDISNNNNNNNNNSVSTNNKEGFIGRYYRPIYRRFRKGISSNVNQFTKALYVSYKKFMY